MGINDVGCAEAERLMREEGYSYVDVRTVDEFRAGHPDGAYNIPVMTAGPGGMQPNPRFLPTMQAIFAPDARIVIGCQAGGRSLRACKILTEAGYAHVRNVAGGFGGGQDSQGNPAKGWRESNLPISKNPVPEKTYEKLVK